MEKSDETCAKCKYSLHRFCLHKPCKDCEMRDKERDVCVCALINDDEDCPYYVKAEDTDNVKDL